jgi:DNA repair protein RadC
MRRDKTRLVGILNAGRSFNLPRESPSSMHEQKIIDQALSILESRLQKTELRVSEPSVAESYLKLQLSELEYESFRVMFLNNNHELIQLKEMFRGTIDSAAVYPREIVKATLAFNAAAVILTHNHPSGNCKPSQADKHITQRLSDALRLIDVRVLDHIVIGGSDSFSFAKHGLV